MVETSPSRMAETQTTGMILRLRKIRNVVIFDIEGSVIGADGVRLRAEFKRIVQSLDAAVNFLVNLRKTGYMDSTGIGALVNLHTEANLSVHKPRVALVGLSAALTRELHLAKLSDLFEQFPDEETALKHLAG